MLQGKANKPCWVLSGTVFHTRARALLLPPHQWSTLTPGCFGRCSRLRTGPPTSRALRWRSTLCCVGLYGEEEDLPGHIPLEMGEKSRPHVPELSRVFHGCVCEDQPLGIEPHAWIPGWVRHEIAVRVAVALVEVAVDTVLDDRTPATREERPEREIGWGPHEIRSLPPERSSGTGLGCW